MIFLEVVWNHSDNLMGILLLSLVFLCQHYSLFQTVELFFVSIAGTSIRFNLIAAVLT